MEENGDEVGVCSSWANGKGKLSVGDGDDDGDRDGLFMGGSHSKWDILSTAGRKGSDDDFAC